MVKNPGVRRNSKIAKQHVFRGDTPVGCFMNIGNSFMMSSPEFCFLQMATHLSLIELIELGFELCGVYSLPLPGDKEVPKRGFYNRKQLTNTKKLLEFLESMPSIRGYSKAYRALLYIQDGSASPMETKLAMFMVLPYMLGGFGFTKPELNKRINLTKNTRKFFQQDYYVCDLFWPDKKVAVEYDSDQNHTGSERIARDSKRRNALATMGIQVVSVTRQQLYNRAELENAARTVAKHSKRRLFSKKNNFIAAHRELRIQLL